MSKSCAKCQKTVYPLEELKCLDKIWHKGCFKCNECGMTLNMKTYKGFDKMPYCEAHVPKAKATTVADTPEFKRIQENTKIQSNAVYHAEFEKTKGKFTQVTDDPELMRIKQNSKIISNVTYHGDLEKKALMEQKRTLSGEGDGEVTKNKNGVPQRSPSSYMDELSSLPTSGHTSSSANSVGHQLHQQQNYNSQHHQSQQQQQQSYSRQPQHTQSSHVPISAVNNSQHHHGHGQQQQQQQQQRDPYNHQAPPQQQQQIHHQSPGHYNMPPPQQQQQQQQQQYNPSPYSSRGQANVIYTSDGGPVNANASKKVGSIADYDPMNNYYGSAEQQRAQQHGRMGGSYGGGNPYQQQPQSPAHIQQQQQMQQKHHQQPPPQPQYTGVRYRALYDYEAQDVDELSFLEGDLIVDCTPIDEGWLTGTNLRSKARGMLPANYVQPA